MSNHNSSLSGRCRVGRTCHRIHSFSWAMMAAGCHLQGGEPLLQCTLSISHLVHPVRANGKLDVDARRSFCLASIAL